MDVFVELGKPAEATRLMAEMRAAGHSPGWCAYHILMKYYARQGDMNAARRLFKELRASEGDRTLSET